MSVLDRFLRYVAIDTRADEASTSVPSTPGQLVLLDLLATELRELGLVDVERDANGYLFATIEPTVARPCPTIGFIAHVDTSPEMSGANVRPIVHREWDGRDIVLPDDPSAVLRPSEWPELAAQMGHDIVTASGTTLLGGDDKAGVAAIVAAAEYLVENPSIPHGRIRLGFTPDEEIGRGPEPLRRRTVRRHVRVHAGRWRCWTAGDGELLSRRDGRCRSSASTRIPGTPRDGWSTRSRPRRASSIGCRTTACRRKRPSDTRGSCIPIRWRRPSIGRASAC